MLTVVVIRCNRNCCRLNDLGVAVVSTEQVGNLQANGTEWKQKRLISVGGPLRVRCYSFKTARFASEVEVASRLLQRQLKAFVACSSIS